MVEHAFRRGVPRHDPVRRALQAVLRDGNHDPEILAMQPRARREELAAHAGRGQHVDAVGRAARLAGDRAREAVAPLGQLRVLLQCHVAHGPVAAPDGQHGMAIPVAAPEFRELAGVEPPALRNAGIPRRPAGEPDPVAGPEILERTLGVGHAFLPRRVLVVEPFADRVVQRLDVPARPGDRHLALRLVGDPGLGDVAARRAAGRRRRRGTRPPRARRPRAPRRRRRA